MLLVYFFFFSFSIRIRFIRYEDLAMNPVESAKNMYKFLHLPWTQQIETSIAKQTGFDKVRFHYVIIEILVGLMKIKQKRKIALY